jgi:hypothetical protein
MLTSHQENFIASQPNASTMVVPENVSVRCDAVSPLVLRLILPYAAVTRIFRSC